MSPEQLPKFRKPPLTEVVHGVEFERLPITIVHHGLFFSRIRDRFPRSQTVVALPPFRTTRDSPSQDQIIRIAPADEVPRAWFIEEDEARLVQLQADRLLFNWRHEPSMSEYPHFDRVHDSFAEMYREFENFADDEALGAIKPQNCEMTYINLIPLTGLDGKLRSPQELVRVHHDNYGREWTTTAEAINWSEHHILQRHNQPIGRLTATLANVVRTASADRALQLDITVQGPPAVANFAGVSEFHEIAHEAIVNYFTAITTDVAHEEWERERHP